MVIHSENTRIKYPQISSIYYRWRLLMVSSFFSVSCFQKKKRTCISCTKIVLKTFTHEMTWHCLIIKVECDTSRIISELMKKFIPYLLFIFIVHLILRNSIWSGMIWVLPLIVCVSENAYESSMYPTLFL